MAKRGFQVVLTGSLEELPLTQAMARAMQAEAINLAGCTSLGALAALLKRTRLLICNDTGVSHLADALQVPSAVIFTDSNIERWAPLDRVLHPVVKSGATPADVIAQVNTLLPQPTILFNGGDPRAKVGCDE
jgi:ADP-heptose:LPS heptosyltransferase